jgi:hypothetical protein
MAFEIASSLGDDCLGCTLVQPHFVMFWLLVHVADPDVSPGFLESGLMTRSYAIAGRRRASLHAELRSVVLPPWRTRDHNSH